MTGRNPTAGLGKQGGLMPRDVIKVVRRIGPERRSARVAQGDQFSLLYTPGRTTCPPLRFILPIGYIFAFEDAQAAINWMESRASRPEGVTPEPGFELWIARARVARRRLQAVSMYGTAKHIRKFWRSPQDCPKIPAPQGTVLCSELMLIREITPENWLPL